MKNSYTVKNNKRRILAGLLSAVLAVSLLFTFFSGITFDGKIKRAGAAVTSTLPEAHALSEDWDSYLSDNAYAGKYSGKQPIEFLDFLSAGFADSGQGVWDNWKHSDAAAILPQKYYFIMSSAVELMYFSWFANGAMPGGSGGSGSTDTQAIILNTDFYLGNNIFYGGRNYVLTSGATDSNAAYSGAPERFLPVIGFNAAFDGQGFEIYDLQIDGETTNYYSMFAVPAAGAKIRNFGLVNAVVDLGGDALAGSVYLIADAANGVAFDRLFAVGTRYENFIGAFDSELINTAGATASEYYIEGTYYIDANNGAATGINIPVGASSYNALSADSDGLIWYGENCRGYNAAAASYTNYYTPFSDNAYLGSAYRYLRLQGIRTFTGTLTLKYYVSSTSTFTLTNNYLIYRPADLIFYLASSYKSLADIGVGIIVNDLDLGGVSNRAYVAAYIRSTVHYGLVGYKGYTSGDINIDSNTLTSTSNNEDKPTYTRNVKIYNYNNRTYRNSIADPNYTVTGLFESHSHTSATARITVANINFMNGYTALAKEAFNKNITETVDGNGDTVVSYTNRFYAVGLAARSGQKGVWFVNLYYNVDTYSEFDTNGYKREQYMGALVGRHEKTGTDTTADTEFITRCVVSGNVDGSSSKTYATGVFYTGGMIGLFASSNDSAIFDRAVFSGGVYGFKPGTSNAAEGQNNYANRVDAVSYTGGFAGRFIQSSTSTKLINSVLVTGRVQTYAHFEDDYAYRYYSRLNFYVGGMIGYDSSTYGLRVNGGSFRFDGELVVNTCYTSGDAATSHFNGTDIYGPKYYTGMYAGHSNAVKLNQNEERLAASQDYTDAQLKQAANSSVVLTGSYYSYYFNGAKQAVLSEENDIKVNDPLMSLYAGVFSGTAGSSGAFYNIDNEIDLNISGVTGKDLSSDAPADAYQINVSALGAAANIVEGCTSSGDILVSGIKMGYRLYISALVGSISTIEDCTTSGSLYLGDSYTEIPYLNGVCYTASNYKNVTGDALITVEGNQSSGSTYINGIAQGATGGSAFIDCEHTADIIFKDSIVGANYTRVSGIASNATQLTGTVNCGNIYVENVNTSGSAVSFSGMVYTLADSSIEKTGGTNYGNISVIDAKGSGYQYLSGVMYTAATGSNVYNMINYGNLYFSQDDGQSSTATFMGGIASNPDSAAILMEGFINYGNITLNNAATTGTCYLGGVIGNISSLTARLSKCVNLGTVSSLKDRTGNLYMGGIIARGNTGGATVVDCVNGDKNDPTKGNVIVANARGTNTGLGGIAGVTYRSSIERCVNYSPITANLAENKITSTTNLYIGGILGYKLDNYHFTSSGNLNAGNIDIKASTNTYTNSGIDYTVNAGGIIGYAYQGTVKIYDCTNTADVVLDVSGASQSAAATRLYTRLGGIVGYANTTFDMRSVMNYGDISNGWAIGGIIGAASTNSYINGAVNYGEVSSNNGFYYSGSLGSFYSVGSGGIVGLHAAPGSRRVELYNIANYGKVLKVNDPYNKSGGLIGNRRDGAGSGVAGNLTGTAGTFTAFYGGLYVIYDTSADFTDVLVSNITVDGLTNNLALAVPQSYTYGGSSGASKWKLTTADGNGLFGKDFFWSVENELTYDIVDYTSYTYSGGVVIDTGSTKAINLPQLVFSEQAAYNGKVYNGGSSPNVDQDRGFEIDGKTYIFALTTTGGRRDGVYVGENYSNATASDRRYLEQILLSRDFFVNNDAYGSESSTGFDVYDVTAGRDNIRFDNNSLSEKSKEELASGKKDTIIATALNYGEYVTNAQIMGSIYNNFTAFTGGGNANSDFFIRGGADNIFSKNANYKIVKDNNVTTVPFTLQNGPWNAIMSAATVYVWQGDPSLDPTDPAQVDPNYVHEYRYYIVFLDTENELNFVKVTGPDGEEYLPTDSGYTVAVNGDSQAHSFGGDEITVDSRENFTLLFEFEGDGVPNSLLLPGSGRYAQLSFGGVDIDSAYWRLVSTSYEPINDSGGAAIDEDLQEILGDENIYLKSRIIFEVAINLNKLQQSYSELAHKEDFYDITLSVFKKLNENNEQEFFEQGFLINKLKSTDTTLYRSTSTNRGIWFIDGTTGSTSAWTNPSLGSAGLENHIYNYSYAFGRIPDFRVYNQPWNTSYDYGIAAPRENALALFNDDGTGYFRASAYASPSMPKSVTLTKNANGLHVSTLVFDITAEDGVTVQEYTFIFTESAPTVTATLYDESGTTMANRTAEVARGEQAVYNPVFTSTTAAYWSYKLYLEDIEIIIRTENGNEVYYYYDEGGDLVEFEGLVIPQIDLSSSGTPTVTFSPETSGGLWKIQPYFTLDTTHVISGYTYEKEGSGGFTYDGGQVKNADRWATWDDLLVANTDFYFNKVTSRLCYAEFVDIASELSVGVLPYYYQSSFPPVQTAFANGKGLVPNLTTDSHFNEPYNVYKYDYDNLKVITSSTVSIPADRIKTFENFLTVADSQFDIAYYTYVVFKLSKYDDIGQVYNDKYTTLKFAVKGHSEGLDFESVTAENYYEDDDYRYFRILIDDTIAVPVSSTETRLSMVVRLTAENPAFYTDYNFIFRMPLNNKSISIGVTYDSEGSAADLKALLGLRMGDVSSGQLVYTRSVNLMFLKNSVDYGQNSALAQFKAAEIEQGIFYNEYRTRNFSAGTYYFYMELPPGYVAELVSIKIGSTVTEFDGNEFLYENMTAQGAESIYLPADLAYVTLLGDAPSTIYLSIVITRSVSPPHWAVET